MPHNCQVCRMKPPKAVRSWSWQRQSMDFGDGIYHRRKLVLSLSRHTRGCQALISGDGRLGKVPQMPSSLSSVLKEESWRLNLEELLDEFQSPVGRLWLLLIVIGC